MMSDNNPDPSAESSDHIHRAAREAPSDHAVWMVTIQTLTEKIQQQDRLIADLHAELQRAQQADVGTMLRHLRLHETVLLYLGRNADTFTERLHQDFGAEMVQKVSDVLFVLDNAPIEPATREAIRQATQHGMNRW
jgi:K+-sensing histidine kinase KdpD